MIGSTKNVLLPNGDITLCCMDYGNKHVLGNLINDSVKEIEKSEESKLIKDGLLKKESHDILCRTCHEGYNLDLEQNFITNIYLDSKVGLVEIK